MNIPVDCIDGSQSEEGLMGITEKMWDGITRVIKMDTKVEGLASTIADQQRRIEDLTGRIIRLETALEIALVAQGKKPKQIPRSK